MQELKDDILERTQQMKSLCHDAETAGIQTVVTLADQSEQLDNMNSRLQTIDITLIDTKQNINRLKGITQRVMDTFRTKFHRKFPFKITLNPNKKANSLISTSSSLPRRRQSSPNTIENNILSTNSFTDKQIDETLYDIESVMHRLKYIAQDMNDQLVGQADTLNHIQEHMIQSTDRIGEQNADIKKIL